jgi:hypothetical protein
MGNTADEDLLAKPVRISADLFFPLAHTQKDFL